MKARLVIITVLLCLALTACSSKPTGQNTDPAPKQDTSAGQSSAAETPDKEPVSDNETHESAGTPVSEDTFKQLQELFSDPNGWYARILTSEFAQPKEINLKELFYKGITEDDSTLTDEETAFLADTWTEDECSLDTYRIPADEMDGILQKYLGVSFEDTLKNDIDDLTYWEKTNAYYLSHGDTNAVNVKIISAYLNEDGTITMTYCDALSDPAPEKAAVLKPCDGEYLIVSNQPV